MSPLAELVEQLRQRSIAHALIGAAAMALHGISRSTFDIDLLVVDLATLDDAPWQPSRAQGWSIDVRVGDSEDPLAGVVRMEAPDGARFDLIVGRASWQADVIARAKAATLEDVTLAAAIPSDLILLKLYAGGPQDMWDVAQLLDAGGRATLVREVEARLSSLPKRCRSLWEKCSLTPPGN